MSEYGGASEIAAELALEDISDRIPSWYRSVAFTILVPSVVTAVAALFAGMASHETLLGRTEEALNLSIAETSLASSELLRAKHDILTAIDQPVDPAEVEEIARLKTLSEVLGADALEAELATQNSIAPHLLFAIAATIAAVAIAVTGLAPNVEQRWLWTVGGSVGVFSTGLLAFSLAKFAT